MTDVPVSQEAREAAADYQDHARGYACSAPLRDGRADHVCIVQAFAKFEQSIRQQAERDALARMEWRDIESAPVDQVIIAAWRCADSGQMQVSGDVRNVYGNWVSDADGMIYPTAWQPLPPAPEAA